ncbi:isoleucine--tRNA ligase [Candidatus Sumerlaeota bacterium]|nr:isoleucine--tRNA ligase [Candidatus Sumerlaeota bacterium]
MRTEEQSRKFPSIPTQVSFPRIEEEALEFWKNNDSFLRSIRRREEQGAKNYVFYDGPPFATGLPHYGHILTSYIKDTVPRYFTMKGFAVDRRFGWDCHGLPIENEIEKELNISGKQQIEAYGVEKFNTLCSKAVMRYTGEWEQIITRLGRWVDFERDYKTMDLDYMESIMNVFKRLYDKGLIYKGNKVVAYCYRCQTPLSNFEAGLDDSYRPRQDPSVTIRLKVKPEFAREADRNEYFLAWTTTPWTLPSNIALAVGAEIQYNLVRLAEGDYWIAAERMEAYAKAFEGGEVIDTKTGAELAGKRYEPMLPYFAAMADEGGFVVLEADFVSTEDGSGIVHIAPAFGEDDHALGLANNLPIPNPVDDAGCFTADVTDAQGMNVHDSNRTIIHLLKENGVLVHQETIEHSYPHCWRDDSPLIYKAVPTWYVNVTKFKDAMVRANQQINWIPGHIKTGRFGNWLEGARDWAISRNRYWGMPIPIWENDQTGERFVPESVAQLAEVSGMAVTDLHKPAIDGIVWQGPEGGVYRRVPEVLDCWFESGAMPYAQIHYPFEHKQWFEENFPADFIVEYIAQTRGWFYTLVVLSAALFDKPPFTNCVCHGVVLAEDGRKMSKRLKNYPDPMDIVNEFGSDALRIYLLSSAVIRGENLRFSRRGVADAVRTHMIPIWNAFHFFTAYANIAGWQPEGGPEAYEPSPETRSDRYILAKLEETRSAIERNVERYDIVACYSALLDFIDRLNNWYIRLNRRNFWGDDANSAFGVLFFVLREYSKISAPFMPFIAETIYQGLCGEDQCVHLQDWPQPREQFHNSELVAESESIQRIIYLGRKVREQRQIKTRQPLPEVRIAGVSAETLQEYAADIKSELNVKAVLPLENPEQVVSSEIKPNPKLLGPKFGPRFKEIMAAARKGEAKILDDGRCEILGETLESGEFQVHYNALEAESGCEAEGRLIVVLSLHIDETLKQEGIVRDIVRRVQELRKEQQLEYTDRIALAIEADAEVHDAVEAHREYLMSETLAVTLTGDPVDPALMGVELASDTFALDAHEIRIHMGRKQ